MTPKPPRRVDEAARKMVRDLVKAGVPLGQAEAIVSCRPIRCLAQLYTTIGNQAL